MKRYLFEANKKQLEKPTEPRYVYCTTAKAAVYAESEEDARALVTEKLRRMYKGSGLVLGEIRLVDIESLPVDWSYGYGDARKSGPSESIDDMIGNDVIR